MRSGDVVIMTLAFIAAFISLLVVLHVFIPEDETKEHQQSKPPNPTHLNRSSDMPH